MSPYMWLPLRFGLYTQLFCNNSSITPWTLNRSYEASGSAARGGGKTAKPGKRKLCSIFDDVIIPDSCKEAGDVRPEFILTSFFTGHRQQQQQPQNRQNGELTNTT